MYYAKLIVGKEYTVLGEHNESFVAGKEKPVSKALFDYLADNSSFEVREEKRTRKEKSEPVKAQDGEGGETTDRSEEKSGD